MTHPEDATAYLKAKLEDRNPKCGNCKRWVQSEPNPSFGGCMNTMSISYQVTQDLSLCSAWEKKE